MKLNENAQRYLTALRAREAHLADIMKEELPSYREVAGAYCQRGINVLKIAIIKQLPPEKLVAFFDEHRAEIDKDNPQ